MGLWNELCGGGVKMLTLALFAVWDVDTMVPVTCHTCDHNKCRVTQRSSMVIIHVGHFAKLVKNTFWIMNDVYILWCIFMELDKNGYWCHTCDPSKVWVQQSSRCHYRSGAQSYFSKLRFHVYVEYLHTAGLNLKFQLESVKPFGYTKWSQLLQLWQF